MIQLPVSVNAWYSDDFPRALKRELEALDPGLLPLQQGLTSGSAVLDTPIQVMPLGASEEDGCIRARVGVFFSSVIAGCNCADDPTPVEPQNEYCELWVVIDRETAEARFEPAS